MVRMLCMGKLYGWARVVSLGRLRVMGQNGRTLYGGGHKRAAPPSVTDRTAPHTDEAKRLTLL